MNFLERFDSEWGPRLGWRVEGFRAIFEHLINVRASGHIIVETGCARQADNWQGDGQSTYLFDRFAAEFQGTVHSVDIDAKACAYARSIVSSSTSVFAGDSICFLYRLARDFVESQRRVDLLYLDSLDWDPKNPWLSAVHHLKELCAAAPALGPGTLVVVDDSFRTLHSVRTAKGAYAVLSDQGIEGKAKYVAEYLNQIGASMRIEGYQCGWVLPK